jgi:hypothetical protein
VVINPTIALITWFNWYVNLFMSFHNVADLNVWFQAMALVALILMSMGAGFDTKLVNNPIVATYGLSLATNAVATALIGYVYW